MVADPADMAERADRLAGILQQRRLERGISPGLGDDARAVLRTDPGLIGLDDGVEGCWLDIALFGQNRFQRANAQLGLGEFRVIVVVVMMLGHASRIVGKFRLCRGTSLRYRPCANAMRMTRRGKADR